MRRSKKFINQPNLKQMLKRKPEGNPRLDAEDLPKETFEDCSKLLGELRQAEAFTRVIVSKELLRKLEKNEFIKGNALMTSNVAGIQAAQKTDELISLCHPIPITMVSIEMDIIKETSAIEIKSKVETHYKTGVETEKLTLIEWHYGL